MRLLLLAPLLALAGCAITPEKMATRSDYDVCRFTLSSTQGVVATAEARNRALDCRPLYPAIVADKAAAEARAAMASLILLNTAQQMRQAQPVYNPPPHQVYCTSQSFGGGRVDTTCQ